MKVSLNWLSNRCDVSAKLAELGAKGLAHEYSIHVAEIDAVEEFGLPEPVVVGRVLSSKPHPDSDHLNLVEVSLGGLGQRQIVCGAANVASAKYVPVALEGAQLAPDFVIAKRKVRGVESCGMICSEDELGLADARAEGILKLEEILPEKALEANLGKSFWQVPFALPGVAGKAFSYRLRDTVFEIDNKFITNRPDLFSVAGNAREASALLRLPLLKAPAAKVSAKGALAVSVESPRCLAYCAAELPLAHAASPWIYRVLARRSGQPSKSLAVDVTNLVATELGQPMHAFDREKVEGAIHVRQARAGESLEALDGKKYELSSEDLVIADDAKVLAVAGVIGGMSSAVGPDTKTVVFESATFDAVSIRKTATRIGCRTEASQRYEKSLDPMLAAPALARALDYVAFAGVPAKASAAFAYLAPDAVKDVRLKLSLDFAEARLGRPVSAADAKRVLCDLGFSVSGLRRELSVRVPSWRATKDVSRPEDLVEEIGRVLGYDTVPAAPVLGDGKPAQVSASVSAPRTLANFFSGKGFFDLISYSMTSRATNAALGFEEARSVRLANPYSTETAEMRRSVFCSLLPRAADNLRRAPSAAYFECGKVFRKESGEVVEKLSAAGVLVGKPLSEAQSVLLAYARTFFPGAEISLRQAQSGAHANVLHPNMSGFVSADGRDVAVFGALHPRAAQHFGLEGAEVWLFELAGDLPAALPAGHLYAPLAKYPGSDREFALVLPENVPAALALDAARSADPLVASAEIGEVFRDTAKVGEGKKSVLVRVTLRHPEKTLTDAESAAAQEKIVAACAAAGFPLRAA